MKKTMGLIGVITLCMSLPVSADQTKQRQTPLTPQVEHRIIKVPAMEPDCSRREPAGGRPALEIEADKTADQWVEGKPATSPDLKAERGAPLLEDEDE